MNILMIGNGFDLAHELPTHYKDFLDFCENTRKVFELSDGISLDEYKQKYIDHWEINNCIKDILLNAFEERTKANNVNNKFTTSNEVLNELYSCISSNTWIKYFRFCCSPIGRNWIDFESEISRVIISIDGARVLMGSGKAVTKIQDEKQEILKNICKSSEWKVQEVFMDIRSLDAFVVFLYRELERLIRGLEIYIAKFIGDITIFKKNADIDRLILDHVLSFNYSDTFERVYGGQRKIAYDYIHGKADINKDVNSCNLVLGKR